MNTPTPEETKRLLSQLSTLHAQVPGLPWEYHEIKGCTDGIGYIRPEDYEGKEIHHVGDMGWSNEQNKAIGNLTTLAVNNMPLLLSLAQRADALSEEVTQLRQKQSQWRVERMEGRREALAILTRQDPEGFTQDYMGSSPLADTGDYFATWDHEKLRAFFDCDKEESFGERCENHYFQVLGEKQDEDHELQTQLTSLQDENVRLREALPSVARELRAMASAESLVRIKSLLEDAAGRAEVLALTPPPDASGDTPPSDAGKAGWMPIETAPRDGTEILGFFCYSPPRVAVTSFWPLHEVWCGTYAPKSPSHWMPLPPPPTKPQAEGGAACE